MIRLPRRALRKAVDLSTAHITKGDNDRLGADRMDYPRCQPHEYGLTIFINSDLDLRDLKRLLLKGFSQELTNLIKACMRERALMLNLDRDGAAHMGLPSFDW